MRPITRLLPTVTCLLLLTQQAAAQTATLSDLRPSSAVVTNETDEVALQVIEDVFVSLSGTNAVLRASITNEAAIRAAGDAAGMAALYGTNAVLRAAITNITAASLGALTSAPPLADVLAAGSVGGRGLSITNETGSTMFNVSSESGDVKISGVFSSIYGLELETYGQYNSDGYWDFSDWTTYYGPWSMWWGSADDNRRIALVSQIPTDTVGQAQLDAAVISAIAAHAAYWPSSATPSSWFTFTTNNNEITITGYDIGGGTDVVIPDYINGWPVTGIGESAFSPDYVGMAITSVSAPQVTTIGEAAFISCGVVASVSAPQATTIGSYVFSGCSLASVSLPQATTIGEGAFTSCSSLTSISLPQATTIGNAAFNSCPVLASVSLPQVTTIGDNAFSNSPVLTSVYFDSSAPTIGTDIFYGIEANQVTNYVTNPQATGWGATLGGMPVVRLPLYGDRIYQGGELVATTGHVAQAIAAIPEPDLSGKVDVSGGAASNLWLQGNTIVTDSYTNLLWRNVYSNGWHWLVAYTNAPGGEE